MYLYPISTIYNPKNETGKKGNPQVNKLAGLNAKQARFVREYCVDSNGAQAAIRAGYSKNGANVTGSQLLAKPSISEAIHDLQDCIAHELQTEAVSILREYNRVAKASLKEMTAKDDDGISQPIDIQDLSDDAVAAIQEWTRDKDGVVKIKLWPKVPALDSLAKHRGFFVDRQEVTVKVERIERHIIDSTCEQTTPELEKTSS